MGGRETRVPPRIDCIVEVRLAVLRDAGVPIYAGADGVALTGQIRATGISRIWALPKGSAVYSILIAELEVDRLIQHVDLRSLGDISAGPHPPLVRGPKLGTVQASQAAAASSGAASSSTVVLAPAGRVMAAGAARPVTPPKAAPKAKGRASGAPTSIFPAKPKEYPRRNVPGPNALEAEDSLEEEAAQEAEGVEEDSSSSDLPDTRAPQAAVKVKEDEEPAGGAQAGSIEEGVLELGQSVVSTAKEYLARSEALLRAQKLQSRILEVAGTAMVKLEKITKREESLKTLRRGGENRAAGEGADGEEVSDDGQDAPGGAGSSSSARAGPSGPPRPQRCLAPMLTATMDAQLLDAGWPLSRWCNTTCIRRPAMAPLFRPTWGSAPPHLLTLFVKTGGDGCSAEERTVGMGRCPCSE